VVIHEFGPKLVKVIGILIDDDERLGRQAVFP
jgi:hypothetical protein